MLQKTEVAVLDVELDEFGSIACLGYYRIGDPCITQFVFGEPIPPKIIAQSDFFKYTILGSNKIVCYYADHERGLFHIPKDRMIETMSQPYFPKELAIKMPNLDMVSAKYLPRFEPSTAHNIACHNAGCIIKILLLFLGIDSFNRPNFVPKFQKFLMQNEGGLDIGIPFTDLCAEIDLVVIEFILSDDKSSIEHVCYFDFQTQFIRIVRLQIGVDEFMESDVWGKFSHTAKFASLNIDLLRCIIRVPEHRYYPITVSKYSKPEDLIILKGLSNSQKKHPTEFDGMFFAYSQVVKAVMLMLIGPEFSGVHFKKSYYKMFREFLAHNDQVRQSAHHKLHFTEEGEMSCRI